MLLTDTDLEGKYWADDYRKWHASQEVPSSLDRDFEGRFSSKGWEQEYDAAAELYTRSLFESLGDLRFEFHPELQGKTPDFLLHNPFGRIVADVTVLHGGAMSESVEQQDDYRLLTQKLMDIDSSIFAVEVPFAEGSRSSYGRGGKQVSFKKLVRPVHEWVRKQEQNYHKNPEMLLWERSWYGTRHLSEFFGFTDLGIDLKFSVELCLKSEESDEERKLRQYKYSGDIGVGSGSVDDTDDKLEGALKKKISYLEDLVRSLSNDGSLSYIIIVFSSNSFTPDSEDIKKVLYGTSTSYDLTSGPLFHDLRQWQLRAGQELRSYSEGVFTNRRKGLLAVLVCKGHIAYPETCDMSMWVNPYASCFSIPQSLYQLKTYTLNREIVCTPPA